MSSFKKISIVKEEESEENPGGYERRVALHPHDVKKLVEAGCCVSVQRSAGIGVGIQDQQYIAVGASIESHDDVYANKDLIIKYKGPSKKNIEAMTPGTTILCMAHLSSFPDRDLHLKSRGIHTISMENIAEFMQPLPRDTTASIKIAEYFVKNMDEDIADLCVIFIGLSDRLAGAFKYISRQNPKQVFVSAELDWEHFFKISENDKVLIVTDTSENPLNSTQAEDIARLDVRFLDIADETFNKLIFENPPIPKYGKRKIACLHETGYCAANYGVYLTSNVSSLLRETSKGVAVVLGYGNVAQGAIKALLDAGFRTIRVVTRRYFNDPVLKTWFKDSHIIICGAEQSPYLRGENYYITNDNIENDIQKGAVVIDLIGGTKDNRSPVEPLVSTTFLPDVHVVKNGVFIAGLWGWDQIGMLYESAEKYSNAIIDVLLGEDRLINGLESVSPSVQPALAFREVSK